MERRSARSCLAGDGILAKSCFTVGGSLRGVLIGRGANLASVFLEVVGRCREGFFSWGRGGIVESVLVFVRGCSQARS